MKTTKRMAFFALFGVSSLLAGAGGCAGSGFGKGVRTDVQGRMASIGGDLAACYSDALTRDRQAQGTVVVSFVARMGTGKFDDVKVVRSDITDPAMQQCVVQKVGALALQTPVKNQVAVEYPLAFSAHD